ncbi:hypothetical protein A4R44_08146 [Amycolatopsis sp. M39]|nr:hypothetical protein A4R44_08146 [Amycolatopsis sp. M39]
MRGCRVPCGIEGTSRTSARSNSPPSRSVRRSLTRTGRRHRAGGRTLGSVSRQAPRSTSNACAAWLAWAEVSDSRSSSTVRSTASWIRRRARTCRRVAGVPAAVVLRTRSADRYSVNRPDANSISRALASSRELPSSWRFRDHGGFVPVLGRIRRGTRGRCWEPFGKSSYDSNSAKEQAGARGVGLGSGQSARGRARRDADEQHDECLKAVSRPTSATVRRAVAHCENQQRRADDQNRAAAHRGDRRGKCSAWHGRISEIPSRVLSDDQPAGRQCRGEQCLSDPEAGQDELRDRSRAMLGRPRGDDRGRPPPAANEAAAAGRGVIYTIRLVKKIGRRDGVPERKIPCCDGIRARPARDRRGC